MMKVSTILTAIALASLLAVPTAFADQHGKAKAAKAERKGAHDAQKNNDKDKDKDERRGDGDRQEMRFRGMDSNSNGVITRSEWRGNDVSFRQQDTNGDGVLSGAEVRPGAESDRTDLRDRSRREELVARFDRADRNRDGRVARDEWSGNVDAFNRMDRNGDGVITRDEFSAIVADRANGTSGAVPRNATRAYQPGYDKGLAEGRQAGREDKNPNGGKWDLEGQRELERADSGYRAELGGRADYQSGYRAGFRVGYREGFGPRR